MYAGDVEAKLLEWGNRIFNSGPVKKRIRRGTTGLRLAGPHSMVAGGGHQRMDGTEVRRKIASLVKPPPQVMVRISGGGRGIRHIKAHLDYISRNGQIPLEDQNGDKLTGKEDVSALRDEWQFGGFAIDEHATSRQAFNVVLSMPAGTSDLAVLRAAREFASEEFANFQYAMALHTRDTDPDADPSPNPHVHLCVKATGIDGARLNPRKADLHRWRESFARRLREHGVACEATLRSQRMQRKRGEKQSVRHKKARGESFDRIGTGLPDGQRAERARRSASHLLAGYRELAMAFAHSERGDDRQLGLALALSLTDSAKVKAPNKGVVRDR